MKKLTSVILGLSILTSSALAADITKLYAKGFNERIQTQNNDSVPALSIEIKNPQSIEKSVKVYSTYAKGYNERIQTQNNDSTAALSDAITSNIVPGNILAVYAKGYNKRVN